MKKNNEQNVVIGKFYSQSNSEHVTQYASGVFFTFFHFLHYRGNKLKGKLLCEAYPESI